MSPSESHVVYVVDDDPSVCKAIKRLLGSAGHDVRTFAGTRELFAHGRPQAPCCLVLDVRLHRESGLSFQEKLAQAGITVPIIFLTGHGDIPMSVRAMKSGAVDFLTKPFDSARLLSVVNRALQADAHFLSQDRDRAELQRKHSLLTAREGEVFAAVTSGMLNKQIATELFVTEKTIKVHRARVMAKMQARTIAELVRMWDRLAIRHRPPTVSRKRHPVTELPRRADSTKNSAEWTKVQ